MLVLKLQSSRNGYVNATGLRSAFSNDFWRIMWLKTGVMMLKI